MVIQRLDILAVLSRYDAAALKCMDDCRSSFFAMGLMLMYLT